ncbi:DUF3426 domain-containing protein [Pseudahrensia aquimaris]|uniref:DUF3426 domain-containing protein n=1 Tax=Pseudahrensia aquimaris TaxID=744461 RepID=A0ABW3F9N3_9HYPH
MRTEQRIEVAAPPLQPDMRSLLENREGAIVTNLPVVIEGQSEPEPEQAPIRTFVDRVPETHAKNRMPLAPIFGLACLGLLAGGVVFKDRVLDKVPQAYSAYEAAGLISPAPELEISTVETSRLEKDGISRLIIRGEIANIAAHNVPVPPIKLTMRGDKKVALYAWTVSAAKDQLEAGERSRFTAIAHDYPGNAVDVEVEFDAPESKPDEK